MRYVSKHCNCAARAAKALVAFGIVLPPAYSLFRAWAWDGISAFRAKRGWLVQSETQKAGSYASARALPVGALQRTEMWRALREAAAIRIRGRHSERAA